MDDAFSMKVHEALQHLKRVKLNNVFVFDPSVLQQARKASTLAVLLEDVHLVTMNLDTVVLDNVGVMKHLNDYQLVRYLFDYGRRKSEIKIGRENV